MRDLRKNRLLRGRGVLKPRFLVSIFLTLVYLFSFSWMVGEGAGCQKLSKISQKHLLLGKKVKNILDNKARFDNKN